MGTTRESLYLLSPVLDSDARPRDLSEWERAQLKYVASFVISLYPQRFAGLLCTTVSSHSASIPRVNLADKALTCRLPRRSLSSRLRPLR